MGLAAARSENLEHLINWLGGDAKVTLMTARRFPAPWTFDEANYACFIVRDAQQLSRGLCLFRKRTWKARSGQPYDEG